jgi:hypothetical protein
MRVIAMVPAPRDFAADALPHLTLPSLAGFGRGHAQSVWSRAFSP